MSDNIQSGWRPPFDETDKERTIRRLRSHCPEGFDERVQIQKVINGYCHCLYEGVCDPSVTEKDLIRLFYHPEWGGRRVWVSEGKFSVIRHLD